MHDDELSEPEPDDNLADDVTEYLRERMSDAECDAAYAEFEEQLNRDFAENYPGVEIPEMPHYILENGIVRVEPNLFRWSRFLADGPDRTIDRTVVRRGSHGFAERAQRQAGHWFAPSAWSRQRRLLFGMGYSEPTRLYGQEIVVSTVFIGVARECLFESMVFGGPWDQEQRRYDTLGEAKQGHHELVLAVKRDANWCSRRGRGRIAKKQLARYERLVSRIKRTIAGGQRRQRDILAAEILEHRLQRTPLGRLLFWSLGEQIWHALLSIPRP